MVNNLNLRNDEVKDISSAATGAASVCALCGDLKSCRPALFSGLDPHAFDTFISGKRRIERNATLFNEKDKFSSLYIVRFGQLKVLSRDPIGMLHVVKFYMPGDVIGMDAIDTGVHATRVLALDISEVCEIPYHHLKQVMTVTPQFGDGFLRLMSRSMGEHQERSCLLSLSTLDERFASFLLDLSSKYERQGYSGHTFRLSMSRGDIGSYLGTTVESVSRLIARFNETRGVLITGRLVELRDRARLRAFLDGDQLPRLVRGSGT